MKSNWMDTQVSLYRTHADNVGRPATFSEVLKTRFFDNMKEIFALRQLDRNNPDYKLEAAKIKARLQGFTPAALLKVRKNESSAIIERTGIIQFDFDYDAIKDYDVDELKQAIYSLPFICFCALSCTGYGLYALALIAEPERQSEYAEHCFEVFKSYGIKPDESKGKNVNDFRYISYDSNMCGILERKDPEPLIITHFNPQEQPKKNYEYKPITFNKESNSKMVNKLINEIYTAQVGQRWGTVQKVAYTLGGLGTGYYEIKAAIQNNSAFSGQEDKYLKCADVCFKEGSLKPIK